MDNTYAPTENKEQEKIKVESIDTIVTMHGDKPYYENKYREVGDKCYHIGYSSYYLDVALEYRKKYFEVVERESDWIPYSERLPYESGTYIVNAIENGIIHVTFAKWMPRMKKWNLTGSRSYWKVTAWQSLPEPYKGE